MCRRLPPWHPALFEAITRQAKGEVGEFKDWALSTHSVGG